MNTQLQIKSRQPRFSLHFVTLMIGIVLVLVLGGPSVKAQTTTVAPDAPVDSAVTIAAKGTVSDPNGSITVSGNVVINCTRVIDTTSATSPSLVLLDIDLSQLQGTSGSLKTLKTYVTGNNHATEIRPLQASDTVIVTSPYFESTKDGLSARSMLITATLNFDISTGKVTGGTISIVDNVVTKATVGTVAPAL